jgi:hypothetical protein
MARWAILPSRTIHPKLDMSVRVVVKQRDSSAVRAESRLKGLLLASCDPGTLGDTARRRTSQALSLSNRTRKTEKILGIHAYESCSRAIYVSD